MKTKNGISLIVLVITIIVLAILAATVIVSITNSGIINRTTDIVKEHDLAEVRSLASLAWAEALMDSAITSDAEYEEYVINSLKSNGVDTTKYNINATAGGINVDNLSEATYADLFITADMDGVTFTKANGEPGIPDNIEIGDTVIYGDYKYVYNRSRFICEGANRPYMEYHDNETMNGWSCVALDNQKREYGKIATTVLGIPVTNIDYLFYYIDNGEFYGAPIVNAPVIPSAVTSMEYAFQTCQSLEGTLKIYAENIDNCYAAISNGEKSITIQVPASSTTYTTVFEFFKNNIYNIQYDNITIETF